MRKIALNKDERKTYKRAWYLAHKPATELHVSHHKPRKWFPSTENLFCVVTAKYDHATPESIAFALQHLTKKGYKAYIRNINNRWYVIRRFLEDELKDTQFVNNYGEIIIETEDGYAFSTEIS